MSFINSMGLLGLIGIPILILIYIIKSNYKEYNVSSTYIWKLSERFVKKKSLLSKISGLLSLLLQILIIFVLSFVLAHPILNIHNSAKKYVFVVDNSASLNISNRLDKVKNNMLEIVNDSKNNSEFTIIVANDNAITVCEKETSKEKVENLINNIKATTMPYSNSNGLDVAQRLFDEDNSLNVYLFSDINYINKNNIEVINVSDNKDYNASVNSLFSIIKDDQLTFVGEITSYAINNDIKLDLYLDNQYITSTNVFCEKDEKTQYSITINQKDYNEAKVVLDVNDDLAIDNQYILYNNYSIDKYNVLLISEKPFYLKSVLNTLKDVNLTIKSTYTNQKDYDLYIFDGKAPEEIPSDGAIWLININQNIENTGFVVQESITVDDGATLSLTNKNNPTYNAITKNIIGNNISVSKFLNYTLINSFTTIMAYDNHPLIFAGTNSLGNREVVFAFDLHDSNLALKLDYVILTNNMIKYCVPQFCEQDYFECGGELQVNVLPNCEYIRVDSPSNHASYLPISEAITSMVLTECGTYNVEAKINNIIKKYKIYVSFPESEANTYIEYETIKINGEKSNISFDSTLDLQWPLLIVLIVLCLLEWEVYLYEKRYI